MYNSGTKDIGVFRGREADSKNEPGGRGVVGDDGEDSGARC